MPYISSELGAALQLLHLLLEHHVRGHLERAGARDQEL